MAKRKGQTLIEAVVATMIAAVTATAIFSVVLSSQVGGVKSDKRETAAMVVKAAREQLKIYVSAVPGETAFSPSVGGLWPKDASGVWALQSGKHNIISLLSGTQLDVPGATFSYTVTNQDCGFGLSEFTSCKQVKFDLSYPN